MAKRSNTKYVNKRVKVEPKLETSTVRYIQSQYPARIRYEGKTTGKWYVWERSGAVIPVDTLDADEILSKVMNNNPCCGSRRIPQPKFVEV